MSYNTSRLEIAAQVISGFAANPAIFASNDRSGWSLVNCTDMDIAAYAIRLAGQLINANDHMGRQPDSDARNEVAK